MNWKRCLIFLFFLFLICWEMAASITEIIVDRLILLLEAIWGTCSKNFFLVSYGYSNETENVLMFLLSISQSHTGVGRFLICSNYTSAYSYVTLVCSRKCQYHGPQETKLQCSQSEWDYKCIVLPVYCPITFCQDFLAISLAILNADWMDKAVGAEISPLNSLFAFVFGILISWHFLQFWHGLE